MYLTVLNLPRHEFLKRKWTMLSIVMPGPSEPTPDAMHRVMAPIVDDLKDLERGKMMRVAGRDTKAKVFYRLLFASSDMPALRKLTGGLHYGASVRYPCNMCWVTKDQMKAAEGFDPDGKNSALRAPH